MAWTLVRNLSPEAYRKLRTRARRNRRSTDAEICSILHEALLPVSRFNSNPALRSLAEPRTHGECGKREAAEQPGKTA